MFNRFSSLLLGLLIGMLGCNSLPPYKPLENPSIFDFFQPGGYQDHQLDSDTFVVAYKQYRNHMYEDGLSNKWIEVAQEYALYRAAELARKQGAEWFVVLHRDDWNVIGWSSGGRQGGPRIRPGAYVIIRLLRSPPAEQNDNVQKVDLLLAKLTERNEGLRVSQGLPGPDERKIPRSKLPFRRWRFSLKLPDPMPLSEEGLVLSRYSPEIKTTRVSTDRVEIEMWWHNAISPIQVLSECVKVVERERHEVFRLLEWKDEEHRQSSLAVWFRTRGTIVLLQEAVRDPLQMPFSTKELKPNVDSDTIKRRQQAERNNAIDRDLKSGLIY